MVTIDRKKELVSQRSVISSLVLSSVDFDNLFARTSIRSFSQQDSYVMQSVILAIGKSRLVGNF